MDGDGIKQAFCLLKWRASGGAFDAEGRPVLPTDLPDDEDRVIVGYCTRAYDCYSCEFMQQELAHHPADRVTWACPTCVARLKSRPNNRGLHLTLAGYYTEGQCQAPSCIREDRHSCFLQLVLGDVRKESG
jgi:predicted nucleic acid-binding Zn ribbon protein